VAPVTPKDSTIGLLENVKSLPGHVVVCGVFVAALLAACTSSVPVPKHSGEVVRGGPDGTYVVPSGIHKIKHVIVVMQENRSFDSYFGTFPGADGIPMADGQPAVCVPDAVRGCTRPYHDTSDVNGGGPHGEGNAVADVNQGHYWRGDLILAQRSHPDRGLIGLRVSTADLDLLAAHSYRTLRGHDYYLASPLASIHRSITGVSGRVNVKGAL
jgi:hypothetical protein